MKLYKFKICLFGEPAVGKTSLIRRFVYDVFDDKYLSTIGAKVSKKVVSVVQDSEDVKVEMMIWDIMGQESFRQLLKDAYFYGAEGLIGVADITRKSTLYALEDWLREILLITGEKPLILVGNKIDLVDMAEWGEKELKEISEKFNAIYYFFTSAKTGEGVEEAFMKLAQKLVEKKSSIRHE